MGVTSSSRESQSQLLSDIAQYGDRSSSWSLLDDHFQSLDLRGPGLGAQLRYQVMGDLWIMGNEPLSTEQKRGSAFRHFERLASVAKKRAVGFPISSALARELHDAGYFTLPIGVEAIFDLDEYVLDRETVYRQLPLARSLKRKGTKVQELALPLSSSDQFQIEKMTEAWQSQRGVRLGFLSGSKPTRLTQHHLVFATQHQGTWEAVLIVSLVDGGRRAYLQDMIRPPTARAGVMEYLIVETMGLLHAKGIRTVGWGLSPLQGIRPDDGFSVKSNWIYRAVRFLKPVLNRVYPFDSLFEFKQKLRPSRFETRYLVSSAGWKLRDIRDLYSALVPTPTQAESSIRTGLGRMIQPEVFNRLTRVKLRFHQTLTLALVCGFLHVARTHGWGSVQQLYDQFPFRIQGFTWTGLWISPFFHNTTFHLLGDLLTLVIAGILLESLGAWILYYGSIVIGLWLSNPITWLVGIGLSHLGFESFYLKMTQENDYGSSNAVYAMVGVLAALVRSPKAILIPFALNAAFVCAAKNSALAIHHGIALGMGFVLTLAWAAIQRKQT